MSLTVNVTGDAVVAVQHHSAAGEHQADGPHWEGVSVKIGVELTAVSVPAQLETLALSVHTRLETEEIVSGLTNLARTGAVDWEPLNHQAVTGQQ